jgi:hypothetical protein
VKKNKKKIILYTTNDELFTLPLIKKICIDLNQTFLIDIFIGKPNFKRKIKVLLVFILFGSWSNLINLFKKKIKLNDLSKIKNVSIINHNKKKYYFGLSLNYPKKIFLKNYDIYNFHLGNFLNQRGSFIFFYKYLYKWKNLALTFHKINNNYDSGCILNQKTENIKNKNATDICLLYNDNYKFIKKCIAQITKKNKPRFVYGQLNTEPSFYLIIKVYILNIFFLI